MSTATAKATSRPSPQGGDGDRLQRWKQWREDVENTARGRWWEIVPAISQNLKHAVDRKGKGVPCPNPGHRSKKGGASKDGFRIFESDFAECGGGICNSCGSFPNAWMLLAWAEGWDWKETLNEVAKYLNMEWDPSKPQATPERRPPPPPPPPPKIDKAKAEQRLRYIVRTWNESNAIDWKGDGPVVRYLRARGLAAICDDPPLDIREHPGLPYLHEYDLTNPDGSFQRDELGRVKTEKRRVGTYPALIAALRNVEGQIVTLHRIYLNPDGRKGRWVNEQGVEEELPSVKKSMSAPIAKMQMGSAIRLYPGERRIAIAEGIETALAVRLLYRMKYGRDIAVWATADAGKMGALDLPMEVEEADVMADNDDPERNGRHDANGRGTGEQHADMFRDRHPDRNIRIFLPPVVDQDWLDVYVAALHRLEMGLVRKPDSAEGRLAEKPAGKGAAPTNAQAREAPWVGFSDGPKPSAEAIEKKKTSHPANQESLDSFASERRQDERNRSGAAPPRSPEPPAATDRTLVEQPPAQVGVVQQHGNVRYVVLPEQRRPGKIAVKLALPTTTPEMAPG